MAYPPLDKSGTWQDRCAQRIDCMCISGRKGTLGLQKLEEKLEDYIRERYIREESAKIIQACFKGWQARKRYA